MVFYNLLFFIITLSNFTPRIKKILYVSFVILFFILSFLKWEVGTDWESYYNIFINLDFIGTNELVFTSLNSFTRNVTNNYTVMLFIFAIILFYFKYSTIYIYSKLPLLSLLMNFAYFRGDIFFVRQHIATAITLFSIRYILKKNKLKFILCVLFATGFHKSAIIFLSAYVINYVNLSFLTRWKYLIIIIISIIFSFKIGELLMYISNYLPSNYAYKIINYSLNAANNYGYRSWMPYNLVIIISILNRSLIFIFIMLFYPFVSEEKEKKLILLLFISIIGYILTRNFGEIARIVQYFGIIEILVVPNLIFKLSKLRKKIVYPIFLIYLYLKLLMGLSSYYELFVPLKLIGGIIL